MKTKSQKLTGAALIHETLKDRNAVYQGLLMLTDGSDPETFGRLASQLGALNKKLEGLGAFAPN